MASSTHEYNATTKTLESISTETDLQKFVASEIQLTSVEKASFSTAVNKLVHFLQNNTPENIRPRKVIKGGSLGKGTAVKGKSDIDLTLVLQNYHSVPALKERLPGIILELKTYLKKHSKAIIIGETKHAVQVELTGHDDESHSIDILPAVDLDLETAEGRKRVYDQMGLETEEVRQYYSASLSTLQLQLIAVLPTKLKTFIRLVKWWKKECIKSSTVPTSYVMELVVIYCWETNGSLQDFNMLGALKEVLTKLTQHRHFRVEFGRLRKYPEGMARIGNGPYIIDPTNPYNNVYQRPFDRAWDWDEVAREAHKWLSKPLFRGVSCKWIK